MPNLDHNQLVEKAVSIINGSHLPDNDKKLLVGRTPYIAYIMLQMFIEVCEQDPFSVEAVVKSLKKKLEAQGNLKKLHEVIKQERMDNENMLAVA